MLAVLCHLPWGAASWWLLKPHSSEQEPRMTRKYCGKPRHTESLSPDWFKVTTDLHFGCCSVCNRDSRFHQTHSALLTLHSLSVCLTHDACSLLKNVLESPECSLFSQDLHTKVRGNQGWQILARYWLFSYLSKEGGMTILNKQKWRYIDYFIKRCLCMCFCLPLLQNTEATGLSS